MVSIQSTRSHRTALFIDGDALDNGTYRERVERLLQSLNGPNIKTDLFTVAAGNGNGGVVRISSLADVSVNGHAKATDEELVSWAEAAGYDQVLFSKSPAA